MQLHGGARPRLDELAAFARTSPVPTVVVRDRTAFDVDVNPAFAALAGFVPFGELQFIAEDGALYGSRSPFVRAANGDAFAGRRCTMVRPDGTRRNVVVDAAPIFDDTGEPCGAFAILHEAAPEAEAERRLRELAELTPAFLFIADANGRIEFLNPRWTELTGSPITALLGEGWTAFAHPDDLVAMTATWKRVRETGEPFAAEIRMRRADGSFRWVRLVARAARGEDGAIARWFGTGFDTDARRRALDALNVLARGGMTLASDTDTHTMLRELARAALEGLADVCFLDLPDPAGGEGERIVAAVEDLSAEALASLEASESVRPDASSEHPVARVLGTGTTFMMAHVDADWIRANAKARGPLEALLTLGFHSLLVVPLVASGRTIGAMTLVRARLSAPFDQADQQLAEDIGRRAGLALERARLAEVARREALERESTFRRIADTVPLLMWTADPEGSIRWYNARWYEYTGQSPDEAEGWGWEAVHHHEDLPHVMERWNHALATGTPLDMEFRLRGVDGRFRWFLTRAIPLHDDTGRVTAWYGTNTDIDAERRATRTLRTLADIASALTASLGLQATLDAAMPYVVPSHADWAFIALADERGDLRLAAAYHSDPARDVLLAGVVGERYVRAETPAPSRESIGEGRPVLYPYIPDELAESLVEPRVLEVFREVGFRSVIVVPLIAGGEPRGILCVVAHEREPFHDDDVPFFAELANRVAPAIVNAELYERERRVAQTFQAAALPATLPQAPGFRFDAIYEAGRAEALVGGDWYDAFRLVDGRIVISIGDVAGSGLASAVTMGRARQAIRGVAQVHADPALMLEAADGTLRGEEPDRYVTAFVGVIDPIVGSMTFSCAGHPPPFLRRADGTVSQLHCDGLPLGLRSREDAVAGAVELRPGDALLLYTDGLTESTRDVPHGERLVREAFADPAVLAAASPAKVIHDRVLVRGSRDDVAMLTVVLDPDPSHAGRAWEFDATDAAASSDARRALLETLRAAGLAEERLAVTELILAEMIGNVVRYAPGPVKLVLEQDAGTVVVHVLDRGPGFTFSPKLPADPYAESGRGLFLIAALTEAFHVVRRVDGGSHARAVVVRGAFRRGSSRTPPGA